MNTQSILMLVLFALFLGILYWAFRPKAKADFDEIGKSILSEKD